MSKNDSILNLDNIFIPLSKYRILETRNTSEIDDMLSSNFHNGHTNIFQEKKFQIRYNYLSIGDISFNAAATSSGYSIQAAQDMQSFALVHVTHGRLEFRDSRNCFQCVPNKLACLLDFERPSVVSIHPHYNNMTVRFTRAILERTLETLVGQPLRKRLRFTNQIDLSQPGPQRLLAIINQITSFFEQDTGLAEVPLLVGQYEQLLVTALLTCLEHNAHNLLHAPSKPAPPRVITLVESYIEANADKPLNLGDLSALTALGARSIQLAFRKHRGYSPSRFLRECRLARARDMLRHAAPGVSLLSVSLACGFASQSLFCRLYRQRFGETPSETAAKA